MWSRRTTFTSVEQRIVAGSPIQGSRAFAQAACNRNIDKKDLRQGSADRYELRSPDLCCKWRSSKSRVRECRA